MQVRERLPFCAAASIKIGRGRLPRPVFVLRAYASGRLRFRKSIVMHQRAAMPTIA